MSDDMNQPKPRRIYHNVEAEIVDRVRRIETRLTKFMEAQGFDSQTAKAIWTGSHVNIPSPAITLRELLDVIPSQHIGPVVVCIGNDHIVTLQRTVT